MAWTNQYIPLVQQSNERILEELRGEFPEDGIASFRKLCSKYKSIALEIGSGSGMHLLQQAEHSPNTLFVGFELRYKRAFRTIEKAVQRGLENIFMVRGDARKVEELFKREELDKIYIRYPDPWGKERWKKHRLVQSGYISILLELLKTNGELSFRTDHREYFLSGMSHLKSFKALEAIEYSEDLAKEQGDRFQPSSEFELLFISQKKPIHHCTLRKQTP